MNIVARHFRTFLFLAVAGGLVTGAAMASRGMSIDAGTIAGLRLALSAPETTPTSLVPAGLFATPTAEAADARPWTTVDGAVQQVSGDIITIAQADQSQRKAVLTGSTAFVRSATIASRDIALGDTITVIGAAAVDGALQAQEVITGPLAQAAAAGQVSGYAVGASKIAGSVQAVQGNVLTVAQQNGQSTRVTLDAAAHLRKVQLAAAADVVAGVALTVGGRADDSGVIYAEVVLLGAQR